MLIVSRKIHLSELPTLENKIFNNDFDGKLEYDSIINAPRNREAGFPRSGREVADPQARAKIKVINKNTM